jgi:hypothetical protein
MKATFLLAFTLTLTFTIICAAEAKKLPFPASLLKARKNKVTASSHVEEER